jgi:hypothetical protein
MLVNRSRPILVNGGMRGGERSVDGAADPERALQEGRWHTSPRDALSSGATWRKLYACEPLRGRCRAVAPRLWFEDSMHLTVGATASDVDALPPGDSQCWADPTGIEHAD